MTIQLIRSRGCGRVTELRQKVAQVTPVGRRVIHAGHAEWAPEGSAQAERGGAAPEGEPRRPRRVGPGGVRAGGTQRLRLGGERLVAVVRPGGSRCYRASACS